MAVKMWTRVGLYPRAVRAARSSSNPARTTSVTLHAMANSPIVVVRRKMVSAPVFPPLVIEAVRSPVKAIIPAVDAA
ncbi:Uncharacterised protein [Dermatophilus congolensis]|uniref:Uncharacterized protein n=1 Tax=Dermatophilus congolensis TaxID=1863 RepID=A0AA46BP69_9MICO|nr:Uncharacterised protein [Dermatophilus congolensis]